MPTTHEKLTRPVHSPHVSSLDPAAIANRVRQIAHDLQQILKKTRPCPCELIELERRIDDLRVHTHGSSWISIDRWLDHTRTAIRARVVAEQIPIEDIYTSARRCPDCVTVC